MIDLKKLAFAVMLCVASASSACGQTPVPDPVGDEGPSNGPAFDCEGLANIIALTRDHAIPAQDDIVDAAWEAVLAKSQEQAAALAAWRACAREDYQRLMLAWQAAVAATARAREVYEQEKLLLHRLREALEQWVLQYARECGK